MVDDGAKADTLSSCDAVVFLVRVEDETKIVLWARVNNRQRFARSEGSSIGRRRIEGASMVLSLGLNVKHQP